LTSPEVSPLFGETLARFVELEHERIGDPFVIVEVAAGSGSLLRALVDAAGIEAWVVEKSPAARRQLADMLPPNRVVASLGDLPAPLRGVILANELIDNIPMALAQLCGREWRERWVGAGPDGLVFVDADPRPEVALWLAAHAGDVGEGDWVEVQLEAARWLERALGLLEAGSILLVDYGDTKEGLLPRRHDGTLRTYRAHHLGPHPLDEPGQTDITADVNFSALMATAEACGAIDISLIRQDDFLGTLGLRDRLSELRRLELSLASDSNQTERLRIRSLKTEAETLLHPRGLGDFRVLLVVAPGTT
jgi:SAM-dependent MidA family methyltransferase